MFHICLTLAKIRLIFGEQDAPANYSFLTFSGTPTGDKPAIAFKF